MAIGNWQLAIGNWLKPAALAFYTQWRRESLLDYNPAILLEDEMKDFRELQVWQLAHSLALEVYEITRGFPRDETYGLRIQVRRAAASVPENIAEGCGREGDGEFHRFLQIAAGSASELDYELLLARDLGFIQRADYERLQGHVVRVKKMLRSLVQKVSTDRQTASASRP